MFDYVILGYFMDHFLRRPNLQGTRVSSSSVFEFARYSNEQILSSIRVVITLELIDRSISETPSEREVITTTSFDHVNAIYAIKNKSETRGDKNLRAD